MLKQHQKKEIVFIIFLKKKKKRLLFSQIIHEITPKKSSRRLKLQPLHHLLETSSYRFDDLYLVDVN